VSGVKMVEEENVPKTDAVSKPMESMINLDGASLMQDLVADRYRLPWEDEVVHKDGTAYGFANPSRRYGDKLSQAAE
jgi:hypothetical protein